MMVLGLSGGSGSGKSTVAGMFSRFCRAAVFDADKEVHFMYVHCASVINLVKEYFPDSVCEGKVCRKKLSKHFFASGPTWQKFQSTIHSLVLEKQLRFILDHTRARYSIIVLDIPLLYEGGFWRYCDRVLHLDVSTYIQRQRLVKRGMSNKEIEFLLSRQIFRQKRLHRADFYINTGSSSRVVSNDVLRIIKSLNSIGARNWKP